MSAPSGTGKTTVVERLVETMPGLALSRSYTSQARAARANGTASTIISSAATPFEAMVRRGEFLEWADVFGNFYGTGAAETDRRLAGGADLVLVIDVQGARQVRRADRRAPSGSSCCRRRSRRSSGGCGAAARIRKTAIARRLDTARREVSAVVEYDYVVVNDALDRA